MIVTQCEPWSAEDELKLLSAILEFGYGNWSDISIRVGHSPNECENHYLKSFLDEPQLPQLIEVREQCFSRVRNSDRLCSNGCRLQVSRKLKPNVHSLCRTLEAEETLRSSDSESPSVGGGADDNTSRLQKNRRGYNHLGYPADYNAERSEFTTEFDDRAENVLAALCERSTALAPFESEGDEGVSVDSELLERLELALVGAYNLRLASRKKAHKIVRDHSLVDRHKSYLLFQRCENAVGRQNVLTLMRFARFTRTGAELDLLLERLRYQQELRLRINTLLNYRWVGLRTMASTSLYTQLQEKRISNRRHLNASYVPLSFDWVGVRTSRRSSAPLPLHNLPGYSLLDDEEKELCSNARIVPETYHNFKNLFVQECRKNNGLKLASARQLVKIDVNKTRKMYDYLLSKGLIWQPT